MSTIEINGYAQEAKCEHCGRRLKHGIILSDGRVVGATCLDQKLTKPRVDWYGKKYRYGAEHIVHIAKVVSRYEQSQWHNRGVGENATVFELAEVVA